MNKLILTTLIFAAPLISQAKPITVKVKGMVCAFCAQGIEKKFKALSEIEKVHVSLETKKVDLETKKDKDIDDQQITKIITEAGYDVQGIEREK
jgi:mercuric ion binding protein